MLSLLSSTKPAEQKYSLKVTNFTNPRKKSTPRANFKPYYAFKYIIAKFINNPPSSFNFILPENSSPDTFLKSCDFKITKIIVKLTSNQDSSDWDYAFLYRNKKWTNFGGNLTDSELSKENDIDPQDVIDYLWKALNARKNQARLEVEMSFKNSNNKQGCDYDEWTSELDDIIMKGTTYSLGKNKRPFINFKNTDYPSQFEYTLSGLVSVYDFSKY
jgi:hypothetical protein